MVQNPLSELEKKWRLNRVVNCSHTEAMKSRSMTRGYRAQAPEELRGVGR